MGFGAVIDLTLAPRTTATDALTPAVRGSVGLAIAVVDLTLAGITAYHCHYCPPTPKSLRYCVCVLDACNT